MPTLRTRAAAAAGLVLGALAAASSAPPAGAAVEITPDRVVVTGRGAAATVERSPVRLSFQDGAGRTVLAQVPNGRPAPVPGAATTQEPVGTDNVPDSPLYSPFAYEVGGAANAQWPGTPWEGNLLLGGSAGVMHAAQEVVEARPAGDGARLELSTNDPAGRTIVVVIRPDRPGALAVSARVTPDAGVSAVSDSFASGPDEAFRGFGGRHNALDQRGNTFPSYIQQESYSTGPLKAAESAPGAGGDRYMFPNGPTAAYYVHASFVSSRPYGFLLDRTELARWRMASGRADAWQVDVAGGALDYVVAPGEAPAAIGTLTAITGRHRVPAEWALGPTLYRGIRVLSPEADDARSYERKIRDDIAQMDRTGIRPTSYDIEAWGIMPRDTVRDLIGELRRRGIRPISYIRAYVSNDAGSTEGPEIFREAVERGYLAKTPTGQPYLFGSPFLVGAAGLIDFTNPDARAWWERRVREMLDLGFDGFMQDFGEQVLTDMRFADGSTGATMHNAYPAIFHRTTRELFDRYERDHPGRGPLFFFTRTGYTGRPGSSAYENATFPGDENTTWERSNGLASLTTDMLNRAIGGTTGFTTDIGGYLDYHTPPVTKELFLRWSQWAALSPIFRVHNSSSTGTKMPWAFDAEALAIWRGAATLHERARPLILRLWREAERTGIPMTRPLWLQFPGDARATEQDQQWMLGPDVLVAPVVTEGARERRVYFPEGCWRHPETGEERRGPGYATVAAPLDRLPYFTRCGKDPLGSELGLPPAKRCLSRRNFRIRLREPRGRDRLVRAAVRVAGRKVRVRRVRGRLVARVDLRGLPRRKVTVRVRARTARGRTVREARTYRTCVARRAR